MTRREPSGVKGVDDGMNFGIPNSRFVERQKIVTQGSNPFLPDKAFSGYEAAVVCGPQVRFEMLIRQ
jgi:hypothetical protein